MTDSKAFALLMLVAAFAPLYPDVATASSGYASFVVTTAQKSAMSTSAYRMCLENARGNTVNINACTDSEYARLDRRLNRSYQAALRRLSRPKAVELRSDERGWLATRDEQCLADLEQARADGGSRYSILIKDCTLQELKRRIIWIETRR